MNQSTPLSIIGMAASLILVAQFSIRLHAASGLELRALTNSVGQFEKIEFALVVPGQFRNPFDPEEMKIDLHLADPKGTEIVVPAFFAQTYERRLVGSENQRRLWVYPIGEPGWRARFTPSAPGKYQGYALMTAGRITQKSSGVSFVCESSRRKGFVRVSKMDSRFLEFENGQPFFPIGQNLAFIGNQQYVTLPKAEAIFSNLERNGANYLRVWTCCEDWAMAIEARKSAWGRSWDWHPPLGLPSDESNGTRALQIRAGSTLRVDPSHPVGLRPETRYRLEGELRQAEGSSVRLGISPGNVITNISPGNAGIWQRFCQEFSTGPDDLWLKSISFENSRDHSSEPFAWLKDLSLREAGGGPELLWEAAIDRDPKGFYNPVDCFMLDELVEAAEKHGIYLQLTLLTRDLYMPMLKDSNSAAYDKAIHDACRTLRYAIARWGYSPNVAAWEYWNEMDPGLPTDLFYSKAGEFLEETDPYHHLRTTSTWGPSPKDCRHPKLDIADVHFYLRPADKGKLEDEVHAVVERTRWLREQAPAKPAHLGEFGLADDKWRLTEQMRREPELADVHNALWASGLSGASGTALFWWWERLDQRQAYTNYYALSRFLADVPWTAGSIRALEATVTSISHSPASDVRVLGLLSNGDAWLWCFNKAASWARLVAAGSSSPTAIQCEIDLQGLRFKKGKVSWHNTRNLAVLGTGQIEVSGDALRVKTPEFTTEVACRIHFSE